MCLAAITEDHLSAQRLKLSGGQHDALLPELGEGGQVREASLLVRAGGLPMERCQQIEQLVVVHRRGVEQAAELAEQR